jgi:hypothetical protein
MASGSLKVKLRPLRLAFLVPPYDETAILTAIETSSFLWGGAFNPILPVFQRLPKSWKPEVSRKPSARAVLEGYIEAFDPDFVIKTGPLESVELKFDNREVIKCSEILKSVRDDGTPAFGIGLLEVLQHFAEEELKFVRQHPLQIRLAKISVKDRVFLAAAFGLLHPKVEELFSSNFAGLPGLEWSDCSVDNYWKLLSNENLFIRRLGMLDIQPIRHWHHRGDCVFLMNANSLLDVLDYWNLRAAGWNIIPVAREKAADASLTQFVAEFVEENSFAFRGNPELFNHTTILWSRTIPMSEVEQFGRLLKPYLTPPKHKHDWKVTYQPWFPRIWDEWAREKDGVDPCELEVREEEHDFTDQDKHVSFRSLMPEFASRFGGHGKPRCANDIVLKIWSSESLPAEVIPQGSKSLTRAAGAFGFWEWRCAKAGLVYMPHYKNWRERFDIASGESVFAEWLRTKGWQSELSDKGHIAKQMFKQLGGEFGIGLLAIEGVVELLAKLAQNRTIHETAFRGSIAEIANRQKYRVPTAERIAEQLVEARVVQPGLEMQCPTCRQYSWYSVKEADYELRCPKCLEEFVLPADKLKQIAWAYKAIGPFSLPQQAYGVYSVLLTLRFFMRQLDGAVTPLLSFTSKRASTSIEADLALFFRESKYRITRPDLIFAECKTFNEFDRRDADRMLLLAAEFPGAVLVFSTLRKSLTEKEKRILKRVANRGRRYWKADRPYNPVLVLTGNELFADDNPRRAWEEMGGVHASHARAWGDRPELVALADDTQQIYLEMKSWHQWLDERERRKVKTRVLKAENSDKAQQEGLRSEQRIRASFPVEMRQVSRRRDN